MKLLFDQNLSPALPRQLQDLYPESRHVRCVDLREADDPTIWAYAREHDFTVVSKDSDYRKLSKTLGHLPKVIMINLGNSPTAAVEALLRERYADVIALHQDDRMGLLELS